MRILLIVLSTFLLIALLISSTIAEPYHPTLELRQWLRDPYDLNADNALDHLDVYSLAGQFGQYPIPPISTLAVSDDITTLNLDFPTGTETYLLIIRNESLSSTPSKMGIYRELFAFKKISEEISDTGVEYPPSIIRSLPGAAPSAVLNRPLGPLAVGDQRTFAIHGGGPVSATLRYSGTHAAIYVDNAIWLQSESPVGQATVNGQGEIFDTVTYPGLSSVFGNPGDLNGDGQVAILFTTAAAGAGDSSFYAGDLFEAGGWSGLTNSMELLYVCPPNTPERTIAPEDLAGNIANAFQQLVNFRYHVILFGNRDFLNVEENWLNAGLSMLAEDYAGSARVKNPKFTEKFLSSTDSINIVTTLVPNDTQRGGAYLFCRYLTDRYGDGIVRKLVRTGNQGIENVEAATGISYMELIKDWSRAVFLSDLGITHHPRFNYQTFASLDTSSPRWWGVPKIAELSLAGESYFGPMHYAQIPSGGFSYVILRNTDTGPKTVELLHSSPGPIPHIDLIRLPDGFVYPE
ncbi:MAG TPA: hypothetical protein PK395_06075 [bacterium]|nr:hypothetical protein [bacterium]